jgi:hypothetical protein
VARILIPQSLKHQHAETPVTGSLQAKKNRKLAMDHFLGHVQQELAVAVV